MLEAKSGIENINLSSLVDVWVGAINASEKSKKQFAETAALCQHFFAGSVGFMWEQAFRDKYLSGIPAPHFQMTLAKGWEFVSIFGPGLMWDAPGRTCSDHDPIEIFPELFGDPNDPSVQQAFSQVQMQYHADRTKRKMRNQLMERYLNYTPKEQPGGGLRSQSHMAITEALVKGRGCLEVKTWGYDDGSDEKLTGAFYLPVDDLFIDPDCRNGSLYDAKWIAVRREKPHGVVEKEFGWPAGSLRQYATSETKTSAGISTSAEDAMWRRHGDTNELVVYYEIFSKCGVGTRFRRKILPEWHEAFEKSAGPYVRLCVVKGMNEPLNLTKQFMQTATMQDVAKAVRWEIPYHKDHKWPIAFLDFWPQPNTPWPLAPLAMGLGELMFLNVFISSLADRGYRSSLDKIGVAKSACEDAVAKLKSYSHEVIELKADVAKNINELISRVQSPEINQDAFAILDYISRQFDKRVGLPEFAYGLTPGDKVIRSSADSNNKKEAVNVRPEWMQQQVIEWQSQVASLERIAAGWNVQGKTLAPMFGSVGAALWDQLITNVPPEMYVREMQSRVEADSLRRPNKERDNANLQVLGQWATPVLQWYAQSTGDVEPLNAILRASGDAVNQDVSGWMMKPVQPAGPSPEEMQAQQEAMARQNAKSDADIQGRLLKNNKLAHELITKGEGLDLEEFLGQGEGAQPEAPSMQGM
jgi:hypothetical protein